MPPLWLHWPGNGRWCFRRVHKTDGKAELTADTVAEALEPVRAGTKVFAFCQSNGAIAARR